MILFLWIHISDTNIVTEKIQISLSDLYLTYNEYFLLICDS